ncbi:MAG: hypothetical protein EXR79_01665 [Myxococcales bacterium]|nr:hypothetical protein [Myxococcales bacterium]
MALACVAAVCAVQAWRNLHGLPPGEQLTSALQVRPLGLGMVWRSLAVGLGAGACGCFAAGGLGWWLQRGQTPLPDTAPLPRSGLPVGWLVCAAAILGATYGGAHRALSDLTVVGDEASYLGRGEEIAAALRSLNPRALFDLFDLARHRPWPGLLPVYVAGALRLPEVVAFALQGAAAWALLAFAITRAGRALGLRPAAVVAALAVAVTQPLWRAMATEVLADALAYGAVALAVAETLAHLRAPSQRTVWAAGLAIGCAPLAKPGAFVWAVLPCATLALLHALQPMLDPVQRRVALRERLRRLCDLGAVVAAAVTAAVLVGGGHKAWHGIRGHGLALERLGYYDEAVHSLADKALWWVTALPRLATLPLLGLAIWGAFVARGPARLVPVVVLLPLSVHAFAMEAKSLRLSGAALAGLVVLAAVAFDHILAQRARWQGLLAALALVGTLLVCGRDLLQVAPVRGGLHYLGPLAAGDWREVAPVWVGVHAPTDQARRWRPAVEGIQAAVQRFCRFDTTAMLFMELRLAAGRDSGYGAGLAKIDYYVADLTVARDAPLFASGGCLVARPGAPPAWPGGHGRLHGEELPQHLTHMLGAPGDPLARAFETVARVPFPAGDAAVVYRRKTGPDLAERAAWAERVAKWMPESGFWAGLWLETGRALQVAGRTAEACVNLARSAASRPARGLVPCAELSAELCAATALPARAARAEQAQLGCPSSQPLNLLWPSGITAWQAAAQLPAPRHDIQ